MANNLQSNSVCKKEQSKNIKDMADKQPAISQDLSLLKKEGYFDVNEYIFLLGGIIKQAMDDGINYNRIKDKIFRRKGDKHYYVENGKEIGIPSNLLNSYKDGHDFIMSNRLENFIIAFRCELVSQYIQEKYMRIINGK